MGDFSAVPAAVRALRPGLRPPLNLCNPVSAGGVAGEWVTQMLRQTDAKVLKKYLPMKRGALTRLDRSAKREV